MARVELRISGIDEAEEQLQAAKVFLSESQRNVTLAELAINDARLALQKAVFSAVSLPEKTDAESQERA